jgi:hypothetical protein
MACSSTLLRAATACLSLLALAPSAVGAQAVVEWQVVNRFPLFENAEDFRQLEEVFKRHQSATGVVDSPGLTGSLRKLLPIRRTAWRPASGTYEKATLFRAKHGITARVVGVPAGASCSWKLGDAAPISALCERSPVFEVVPNTPFDLTAVPEGGPPVTLAQVVVRERLIVALGDSFGSGEGNPDHPATFKAVSPTVQWPVQPKAGRHIIEDAAWWDDACHRSLLSWPALAALAQAISNPHEVVQFASFACSGAEVYDGMLRAQVDPPGWLTAHLEKDVLKRDGGPGYRWEGGEFLPGQVAKRGVLRLSQLHALALLVCPDGRVEPYDVRWADPLEGVAPRQTYFGEVKLPRCTGARKIDSVLLSIGGNDVGFGGIVRWLITPPNGKNVFNTLLLQLGRKEMGVLNPQQVSRSVALLPTLYAHLAAALEQVSVDPKRVFLLGYPDPTKGGSDLATCNARTRDGNAVMQVLVDKKLGNPDFLFGINPKEFRAVRRNFIEPLQSAQRTATTERRWNLVDSQAALGDEGTSSRGYCSVSADCSASSCPAGERTRWWTSTHYSKEPRLTSLAEFDPYDPSRSRGMRYGVDALLSAAVREPGGGIHDDWVSGSAHPTANVHARIADLVVIVTSRQ